MHVPFTIHYRNNLIDKKKILTRFHVRHLGVTVITVAVITPVQNIALKKRGHNSNGNGQFGKC